jgi:hypothetical protein
MRRPQKGIEDPHECPFFDSDTLEVSLNLDECPLVRSALLPHALDSRDPGRRVRCHPHANLGEYQAVEDRNEPRPLDVEDLRDDRDPESLALRCPESFLESGRDAQLVPLLGIDLEEIPPGIKCREPGMRLRIHDWCPTVVGSPCSHGPIHRGDVTVDDSITLSGVFLGLRDPAVIGLRSGCAWIPLEELFGEPLRPFDDELWRTVVDSSARTNHDRDRLAFESDGGLPSTGRAWALSLAMLLRDVLRT